MAYTNSVNFSLAGSYATAVVAIVAPHNNAANFNLLNLV